MSLVVIDGSTRSARGTLPAEGSPPAPDLPGDTPRVILHVDLDCFFAAVEIRDNPALRGFPVIVGPNPNHGQRRGVVLTCSYEAREFGVHSAMPIVQAHARCPSAAYVRPHREKYEAASQQVMQLLRRHGTAFQQTSIDEAYLDVTGRVASLAEAKHLAFRIQQAVQATVGITCSIGVAPTKSLAKIASDRDKPEGVTVVPRAPAAIHAFLAPLDVATIPGVGPKSRARFHARGLRTIGDLLALPPAHLEEDLGEHGRWIARVIHGRDDRPVSAAHRRKSVGKERTFSRDTRDFPAILAQIQALNHAVHQKLARLRLWYRTLTLKVRFRGFDTYTRATSFLVPTRDERHALRAVLALYREFRGETAPVRLIGVRATNLTPVHGARQTRLSEFWGTARSGED